MENKPAGPTHSVLLKLIGGFDLHVDGEPVAVSESSQRLMAYLALVGPNERRVIASHLWPDKAEDRAGANLRSAIWRLTTPDNLARPIELVRGHHSRLQLADCVDVDAYTLEQVGWSLSRGNRVNGHQVGAFLALGDLLPGWYEDWVLLERERLGQLQLHFLETIAYQLLCAGSPTAALDTALRLVALDPLREGSQRVLLTIYCSEGSLGQAQRQLDKYRSMLLEAFACEPKLSLGRILREIDMSDSDRFATAG
ncbi:MAG: BTAD domain-containing putative transcriptional regulator [Anaerolineaceae bacterium]